jgi:AcrR family transcriptional regulator
MAPAIGRRGEYAKSAGRRRDILEAAVEVFSESGFRAGSLRDVASRVDLTLAGLLHHFPTKNALLEAALEWRDAEAAAELGDPAPHGVDMLRALVSLVQRNVDGRELASLHTTLSGEAANKEHPAHTYFIARYRHVVAIAHAAFVQAAEDGHLRDSVDPGAAARNLIALMDGLQIQWLLDDTVDMAADVRSFLQPLLTVDV